MVCIALGLKLLGLVGLVVDGRKTARTVHRSHPWPHDHAAVRVFRPGHETGSGRRKTIAPQCFVLFFFSKAMFDEQQ